MTVGARDWVKMRNMFQRALVSSAIIFVLVALPAVAVSKWVFQLFGQDDNISITTTICLVICLPGEFCWILYTMLFRTMIAQLMVHSHYYGYNATSSNVLGSDSQHRCGRWWRRARSSRSSASRCRSFRTI